jgi:hypothetical protein
MEKFKDLHNILEYCYTRTRYDIFKELPQEQQERVCQKERENLIEYVMSNEMKIENIIKSKLKVLYGTIS